MKKIIKVTLFMLVIGLSIGIFGCATNMAATDNVVVTFIYSDNTKQYVEVNKGSKIGNDDLPQLEQDTSTYTFSWYIDCSKPITDNIIVKSQKYTKGIQISKQGDTARITGLILSDLQPKPTTLLLPTYYQGVTVTAINNKAFKSSEQNSPAKDITKVVLPEYLTTISDEAFEYCTKLESPIFPDTLTYIGFRAFNGCSFDNIQLPKGITNISQRAFAGGNHTFSFLKVPNGLQVMESYALTSLKLRTIVIPNTIVKIEDGGIWPTVTYVEDPTSRFGKLEVDGKFVIDETDPTRIFYEGDEFDWRDLYENISDVDVANISGSDYEKCIPIHSSRDMVDVCIIYFYSEELPANLETSKNNYWRYSESGEILIWDKTGDTIIFEKDVV